MSKNKQEYKVEDKVVSNKVSEEELKEKYEKEYKRNYVDNIRSVESFALTLSLMSDVLLKDTALNSFLETHWFDPRKADAVVNELSKRNMVSTLNEFKRILEDANYTKPWLRNA